MPRKPPPFDPPERKSFEPAQTTILSRRYRLITPLFGGGVEARVNDPVTPIRGTSIRGQLRFWWRATQGGIAENRVHPIYQNDPLKDMRQREGELWGWAADAHTSADTVQISVKLLKQGREQTAYTLVPTRSGGKRSQATNVAPAYASFPLQPTRNELTQGNVELCTVLSGLEFELTLYIPHAKVAEVEAALWAWETFGGLGARTRRGFGALECFASNKKEDHQETQDYTPPRSLEDLLKQLHKHVIDGVWPQNVPHLSRTMPIKCVFASNDPLDCWFDLINTLQAFRQQRPKKANGYPGQSKWPEADEVRRLWGKVHPDKLPLAHTPKHPGQGFPRAAFGLPIIFHFKDKGDPDDTTLQGVNTTAQGQEVDVERWASPLILRPLRLGGNYVGLAAILKNSLISPLNLVEHHESLGKGMSKNMSDAKVSHFIDSTAEDAVKAFWDSL